MVIPAKDGKPVPTLPLGYNMPQGGPLDMARLALMLLNMTGIPRLMFRLMLDRRVPIRTKLIPVVALVYLISPFDIVHDMIPALGRIDDLLAIVFGILLFLVTAPHDVVVEHIRGGPPDDDGRGGGPESDGAVIDGKYRYVEEGSDRKPKA